MAKGEIKTKKCKCGCEEEIPITDRYGRKHDYVSGHNGRKYKDKNQHKLEWNYRNREYFYKNKIKRGHLLKQKVIVIMGGQCKHCHLKYNGKNGCVFQMHHKKPKDKKFVVNIRTLGTYSWKRILLEIKKCELLCGNCHFMEHNEEY